MTKKTKELLLIGGIAIGAYFLFRKKKAVAGEVPPEALPAGPTTGQVIAHDPGLIIHGPEDIDPATGWPKAGTF